MKRSGLWCVVVSLACISCTPRLPLQASDGEEGAQQPKEKLSLGSFQCIRGTSFLRASLTSNAWRSFASSYSGDLTRNYVFLNGDEVSFSKLFATDAQVIVRTIDLSEQSTPSPREESSQTCKDAPNPIEHLAYLVVNNDTDGDKKLSFDDNREFAIADPSGKNYVAVIQDIQDLHGYVHRPELGDLVLIYRREGAHYASTIDLAERKVTSTETIDILGPNIQ